MSVALDSDEGLSKSVLYLEVESDDASLVRDVFHTALLPGWLLELPKNLLIDIIVNYVDIAGTLSLACINRRARKFYLEHFIYKLKFMKEFGEPRRPPPRGKRHRKKHHAFENRLKDPMYWGVWLRGRVKATQGVLDIYVSLSIPLSWQPETWQVLARYKFSELPYSFFHYALAPRRAESASYRFPKVCNHDLTQPGALKHEVSGLLFHQTVQGDELAPSENLDDSRHGVVVLACARCTAVVTVTLHSFCEALRVLEMAVKMEEDIWEAGKLLGKKLVICITKMYASECAVVQELKGIRILQKVDLTSGGPAARMIHSDHWFLKDPTLAYTVNQQNTQTYDQNH
jgi:hypothetical protein